MRYLVTVIVLLCAVCNAQTAGAPGTEPQQGMPAGQAKPGRAELQGTVSDSTGAVIVGATVTAGNAVAVSKSTTTNAEGKFVISGLEPGPYNVSVTAPNFKEFKTENYNLVAGDQNYLDALLEPAGETTHMEVSGQTTTQVETETAELSGTLTQKQVVTFGLNGRNFTQLLTLTPGVSNQTGQDEAKVGVLGSAKYSVNGGRVEYNTFDVDGSDVLNTGIAASRGHSTLIVYPSLDAIEEMKVLTSNYGAQYGRSASGTVLVTTKSGGQNFHGNAYEFVRNEMFNARGFLDPPGHAPLYRRNDFGFTFGGPLFIPKVYNINKQKTFFFFSEEFRLERTPSAGVNSSAWSQAVPSLNEREGNFSDVCPATTPGNSVDFNRIQYPDCPANGVGSSFGTFRTFPGNIIPIDPNAQAILQSGVIPLANSPGGCNAKLNAGAVTNNPATWPCFVGTTSPNTYWREELFRIDHNFSSTLKGSFRYIHDSWNTTVVTPQWQYAGVGPLQNSFPTVLNRFIGPGLSLVGELTAVKGASLVNNLSVSFTRDHITLSDEAGPGAQADLTRPAALDAVCGAIQSSCGMGYLFPGNGGKIPAIYIGGSNASLGGSGFLVDTSYMPWQHSNPTVSVHDDLSKVLGKHTLHVGALVVHSQQTELSSATGANTGDVQGLVAFGNVSNPSSTGNSFADFELLQTRGGTIRYFQQDSAQYSYSNYYWTVEPYVQDDWRVSPRLTLNMGLRLSLFGNWTPTGRPVYNFVPSQYNFSLAQDLQVNPISGYLEDATGQPILIDTQNPDPRTINGLVQCGVNGVPASCMSSHIFNPAPRFGFAWDPTGRGKTSIRGGYGIFYEHGTSEEANSGSLIGSAPSVLSMIQYGASQGATGTTSAGFSWECIGGRGVDCISPTGGLLPVGAAYPLNVVSIPTKAVWPYVQQWSLSVQREVARDTVATAAYVGSKGTHLTTVLQLNQLPPVPPQDNFFGPNEPIFTSYTVPGGPTYLGVCAPFSPAGQSNLTGYEVQSGYVYFPGDPGYVNLQAACSAVNVNSLRKYPGYGQILGIANIANSSYNALQLTLRHSSKSLSLGVSYTYGHSIDESSDRYEANLGNSLDPRSNRASSDFDQRHLLNVSYVYRLPLLQVAEKLHKFHLCDSEDCSDQGVTPYGGASQHTRSLLDGWELSGITIFRSGTPFSIVNGGSSIVSVLDNAGVANGLGAGSYPDVVNGAACNLSQASGIGPLLGNPCMFVAPRGLTFGDAGRNSMNNPHRTNFDMALSKHVPLPHERSLELRAEAFNVFNTPQYVIYDPDRGNTASNTITCYGDASTGYSAGAPSCLANSQFLRPVEAHRPRTLQFGVKVGF